MLKALVMNDDFLTRLSDNPLATVAAFYAGCLASSDKALSFALDDLKLTADEVAAQQVGFSNRTLGTLIPSKSVRTGRVIRDTLTTLGIYKGNGRETLRGYVTVPIRDAANIVIGIRGYKVDRNSQGTNIVEIGRCQASEVRFQEEGLNTKDTESTEGVQAVDDCKFVTEDSRLITQDSSLVFDVDDRHYRVRGLEKNTSTTTLRVALQVSRDSLVHLDSLDLVKASSRASFVKAAASELFVDADLIKKDIGRLLLQLEVLQADRIAELKQPQHATVKLTANEEREAMELLRDPNLLERIVADAGACGVVGESTGKLVGYLAATSRKLKRPLAVVIQSSSSAGKTSLMDAILSLMPGEDVLRLSGLTGQSLFYLDSDSIRHKILAISEDEGASDATYALKLLQSEGELRHASVGRGENGQVQTQQHHVQGPVQLFLTTTAMQVDEELVNRCLLLSVDETRDQTFSILTVQRSSRTLDAIVSSERTARLRTLHQNAQRLLRPLRVVNPYAPQLTFATNKTRLRRDHEKYLTLIDTIAFLHQHQRKLEVRMAKGESEPIEYINVERSDIAVANGIAGEVLGRSLDELSPQTRHLLNQLHSFVNDQAKQLSVPRHSVRFTRRDVRDATGSGNSQTSIHLQRLVDLEYVLAHRGRNGQRYVYELLYNGEGFEGQPFLMGLLDPSKLQHPASMTQTFRGCESTFRAERAT
jgi:DNA primase